MKKVILTLILVLGTMGLCPAMTVGALPGDPICKTLSEGSEQWEVAGCHNEEDDTVFDRIPGAVMAVFSVVGIVVVGVIIFGGVRYSISQGDPGKVKKAKDTIMYAVIGLMVTLTAFAIVTFIVGDMLGGGTDDTVEEVVDD